MIRRLMLLVQRFVATEQSVAILAQHAGHADLHDALLLAAAMVVLLATLARERVRRTPAARGPSEAMRRALAPAERPQSLIAKTVVSR